MKKYYLSTIADVAFEEDGTSHGKLKYEKRTGPLANRYGLGIEIAEFCISDNMDLCYEEVLPHARYNASMSDSIVLHAPYNELFPMAIDSKVAAIAWDRYSQTLELCKMLGADKMIVHANYFQDLYYPEWFISRHVDFWRRFLEEKNPEPIICVENVRETDPELILEILRQVNDPRLKMCLDAGHANLTGLTPEYWLKACAPFISHYHLHNNNGPVDGMPAAGDLHAALGCGAIDMKAFLDLAEELTPDATATIESSNLKESISWLLENDLIHGQPL